MSEGAGGPLHRGIGWNATFSEFRPQACALCRQFRIAPFGIDHEDHGLPTASLFHLLDAISSSSCLPSSVPISLNPEVRM